MQPGKILVAQQGGAFVIKLAGDVRLTFCTTLDEFFDRMFAEPNFASVIIDLCEAENIDSTTLGQLAKLAITAKRTHQLDSRRTLHQSEYHAHSALRWGLNGSSIFASSVRRLSSNSPNCLW